MEIIEGTTHIRILPGEAIYEAINLIKPNNTDNSCRFFSGHIEQSQEPAYDGYKLLFRTYELVKRHLYIIEDRTSMKYTKRYVKVTSVGHIVEISREEACEILEKRGRDEKTGAEKYVLDVDIKHPPNFETEEAPTPACDW